jgi:hydrogenase maturation protease
VTTLVVAVGHPDRGDDAIGSRVADHLAGTPGVVVRRVEGDATAVLSDPRWDRADRVVVVDAVRGSGAPGTVLRWSGGEALASFPARSAVTHDLGVAALLQLAAALDRLPPELTVIGVVTAGHEVGRPPSPAVTRAARHVADELRASARIGEPHPNPPPPLSERTSARRVPMWKRRR